MESILKQILLRKKRKKYRKGKFLVVVEGKSMYGDSTYVQRMDWFSRSEKNKKTMIKKSTKAGEKK